MIRSRSRFTLAILLGVLLTLIVWPASVQLAGQAQGDQGAKAEQKAEKSGKSKKEKKKEKKAKLATAVPVLWEDRGDISRLDLTYGPGSKELAPQPPFKFLKEDKDGASPKFKVEDARGVEWSVKLGPEAQSETVSTRIVWAAGYYAEETYYMPRLKVENLPRLSRGNEYIEAGGIARGVRLEPRRKGVERGDPWDWEDNPFVGTKELDGLKVIQILLQNHDVRPPNNKVFYVTDPQTKKLKAYYGVSDLGATLGRALPFGKGNSKNNLEDYLAAGFIKRVKDGEVIFDYHQRPTGFGLVALLYPPYFIEQAKEEKAMQDIRVEHARWIGDLLSRLTDKQLDDAFRVAEYTEEQRKAYIGAMRSRINQLTRLESGVDRATASKSL